VRLRFAVSYTATAVSVSPDCHAWWACRPCHKQVKRGVPQTPAAAISDDGEPKKEIRCAGGYLLSRDSPVRGKAARRSLTGITPRRPVSRWPVGVSGPSLRSGRLRRPALSARADTLPRPVRLSRTPRRLLGKFRPKTESVLHPHLAGKLLVPRGRSVAAPCQVRVISGNSPDSPTGGAAFRCSARPTQPC